MGFQDRVDLARLLRRVDGRDVLTAVQLILLATLAFLVARLIWAAVAPIGPIGTPIAASKAPVAVDKAIFAEFDPFFQAAGSAGPIIVSDLDLDVYGTRVDNVSGRGSAILSAGGGAQQSFFVGEEVLPGVTLRSVAFDSVTISRNGVLEQLFLDQSIPARTVAPTAVPESPSKTDAARPSIDVQRFAKEINVAPLMVNGRVDGMTLNPVGDGEFFNELGLMPGDVLVSVNRVRIDTKARAENLTDLLGDDGVAVLEIRRGAQVQTISFEITR